jgi:glycerol uptake facilitator-like aquaporin
MSSKRYIAEFLGTAGLLCAVVGSGIMALRRELSISDCAAYCAAQIAGAMVGVWLAYGWRMVGRVDGIHIYHFTKPKDH